MTLEFAHDKVFFYNSQGTLDQQKSPEVVFFRFKCTLFEDLKFMPSSILNLGVKKFDIRVIVVVKFIAVDKIYSQKHRHAENQ